MLLAGADPASFDNVDGVLVGHLSEVAVGLNRGRLGQPMPCGNEGAGMVVDAGPGDAAQALLGKRITGVSGSMYATHTVVSPMMCMEVPAEVTAEQAASSFVNPLTALGMTETMRDEGHTALVHTAAASNLGQMLVKICIDDGIDTVEGVIQAVGLQQITPCELTSPFLKKRGLAGGSHHATDLVAFIKGTAGDLSPQGARATHHQNLHGAHVNKAGSLDGPCHERGFSRPGA